MPFALYIIFHISWALSLTWPHENWYDSSHDNPFQATELRKFDLLRESRWNANKDDYRYGVPPGVLQQRLELLSVSNQAPPNHNTVSQGLPAIMPTYTSNPVLVSSQAGFRKHFQNPKCSKKKIQKYSNQFFWSKVQVSWWKVLGTRIFFQKLSNKNTYEAKSMYAYQCK